MVADIEIRPDGDQLGNDAVHQALSVIDKALATMMNRELVSSREMADLLLDLRLVLTTEEIASS
jgi:hypothetical protein